MECLGNLDLQKHFIYFLIVYRVAPNTPSGLPRCQRLVHIFAPPPEMGRTSSSLPFLGYYDYGRMGDRGEATEAAL